MSINRDYTRSKHQRRTDVFGPTGVYRNKLAKLLSENVCRVLCICSSSHVDVNYVTLLSEYIVGSPPENSRHDCIWAWDTENDNWRSIDIHLVKSISIIVEE